MRRATYVLGLLFSLYSPAITQDFDVESAKRASPDSPGADSSERITRHPGELIMHNVTLSTCIQWAFNVQPFQVSGPSWLSSDRYEIWAKASPNVSDDQLRIMLRNLLVRRFGLQFHHESKAVQLLALTVGKRGPRISQAKASGEMSREVEGTVLKLYSASMSDVTLLLSSLMRAPVIDRTDLAGKYDLSFDVTSIANARAAASESEAILAAMEQQLGLRLEPKKIVADIIFIDQANRTPVAN
ncbi:MAG: TIGR03435 family protein [Candidatus Solibacter usitatus]|nr:TIGR03435 family protein [Candidatus Solibacter usitatus]